MSKPGDELQKPGDELRNHSRIVENETQRIVENETLRHSALSLSLSLSLDVLCVPAVFL